MEFWGVEVPAGAPLKCVPGDDKYLHLSQASLGEFKKGSSVSVPIFVTFEDKKFCIATLTPGSCNQISLDLIFEKEVHFSHGWKDGSVFFTGYKTINAVDDEFEEFGDSESEDDVVAIPLDNKPTNGKVSEKIENAIAIAKANAESSNKAKTKLPVLAMKDEKDGDEDDDSDDGDSDEDDSDEDMIEGENDSADEDEDDEEDDSSDEEEKVSPPKAKSGKKRAAGSDAKASLPEKKAKIATPVGKSGAKDGKKGDKKTTPIKPQTPKSVGSVSCKKCSKTFNSDAAMESHSKAKHGGN